MSETTKKPVHAHSGHRKRMYERFANSKGSAFADHELLEMYLFGCIPRRNTNEIAHALIDRFGSLDAVFDADLESLMTVDGISKGSAVQLRLFSVLSRRYSLLKGERKNSSLSTKQIGRYLIDRFHMVRTECILLLCFDSSMRLICTSEICEGCVSSAEINVRRIAEVALSCSASFIALAHNHPSGGAEPSDFDVTTTRMVKRALDMIDLPLIEHFIVGGDDYCTLLGSDS